MSLKLGRGEEIGIPFRSWNSDQLHIFCNILCVKYRYFVNGVYLTMCFCGWYNVSIFVCNVMKFFYVMSDRSDCIDMFLVCFWMSGWSGQYLQVCLFSFVQLEPKTERNPEDKMRRNAHAIFNQGEGTASDSRANVEQKERRWRK